MQGKWPRLKTLRYGLLLAVSVATLSGCVSAVSTDMRADAKAAQEKEDTVADGSTDDTTTPVVASGAAARDADAATAGQPMTGEAGSDTAGLIMQPTTLNAGQASIYSNGGQVTPTGTAYSTQTAGTNATTNSLYAAAGMAQTAETANRTGRLPVEDMPPVDSSGQQVLMTPDGEQAVLPENVPIPKTARTALVAEAATGNAADQALALPTDDGATVALPETAAKDKNRKTVTLASLFADKREAKGQFDGERFVATPRRVINRDSANATQMASLGSLPGVTTGNAYATTEQHSESEEVEDDAPQFKEVASLAGLARLAPNGLWLQTEKVKTGCFKPELLQVLKTIEKHYDKPIIVTSGLRDIKVNRAKQSLHTRCEAADIQIAGVSKWELADYLRSMPGRGGVGTYCHTESVHIDIGPERDWNWRCRRRK